MKEKRYEKFKYPRTQRSSKPTLRECTEHCIKNKISCPEENSDCKHWINYEDDYNCTLYTIQKNKYNGLTLHETAKRLGLSFVRIKQIEDSSLEKLKLSDPQLFEYLLKDDF